MPPEKLDVRQATPADFGAVLEFWRVAAYGASPTDDEAALTTLHDRDHAALLLALDGEHIVGSVIVGWDGWRAGLYRLAVLDEYRRQGVGALLVREAERRLRALGAHRIGALVEVDNERGRGFWAALGYTVADSQMRYMKDLE